MRRSWRGSSEQLQWQVADLQRKLKDSEQRSTLWARRAGAAEARVPVQATCVRQPLPKGLFPAGCDFTLPPAAKAGLGVPAGGTAIGGQADAMGRAGSVLGSWADPMGRPVTVIGNQADSMGRPGTAKGRPAESIGDATGNTEEVPGLQQGRGMTWQQAADEEEHEEGCALALLQEALSAAPGQAAARLHTRPMTGFDDGITIGARHMQPDESILSAAGPPEDATLSTRQLSSLQQRIADYEKQNGLAALQGLNSIHDAGCDGKLSSIDDAVSPLKQRIAEYNAQHIMCKSPRSPSSPRIDSRFGDSSRTDH